MADDAGLDGASLQKFLSKNAADREPRVTSFRPISGGYSRLSALGCVQWSDGTEESFVLRADPPPETGVFESDRDDEARLLRSLHGNLAVKTPNVRWYDATGEYFGQKCLVVDFFDGRQLPEIVAADGVGPATAIFVDTFSKIHLSPLDVLPPELPRPDDWDAYVDGLIDQLAHMDDNVSDSAPALHYAAARLRRHRPPPVPLALVHGDCQPANILVPAEGDVLMIDWEFGHIGDPREDLGYYSHLPVPPNLYEADPEAFLADYRARTGFTEEQVNPQTVSYFYVLGMTRLLGQMYAAADALTHNGHRGAMASYMINGIAATTRAFVDITRSLTD